MRKKAVAKKINSNFKNKNILSIDQFDPSSFKKLFKTTQKLIKNFTHKKTQELLKGKVVTLLFFEPSSRTFSSFSSGVKRLGGLTIEYQNPLQTSSTTKGETFEDMIKVFESYSDAIIIRHFKPGASEIAAKAATSIPIINAGDGAGEHPTQALFDFFTIYQKFKRLQNLKGVMAGDLLYGRTVHSLLKGFAMYKNNTIYLLSPKPLRLSKEFTDSLKGKINLVEIENENDIPKDCHFWYWTRVQKERFASEKAYEEVKNKFILTTKLLRKKGNRKLILMHPLPRVGEIEVEVDAHPRAVYLTDQVKNGLYVRMALLSLILGKN